MDYTKLNETQLEIKKSNNSPLDHKSTKKAPSLEEIFEAAIEAFPYELESTSITQGDLETLYTDDASDDESISDESISDEPIEYAEEFTFEMARLIDQPLIGGGWIEIRRDAPDEDISIWGHFTIALNGDFKDNRILADDKALQGHYDIENQTWELAIDFY